MFGSNFPHCVVRQNAVGTPCRESFAPLQPHLRPLQQMPPHPLESIRSRFPAHKLANNRNAAEAHVRVWTRDWKVSQSPPFVDLHAVEA
jgi:hypothetical protein